MLGTAGMTDEQAAKQWALMMGTADLSLDEKQLARQQAMTNQLRMQAMQPSSGKDFGSQMARALHGGMAAYSGMQDERQYDPTIEGSYAAKKALKMEAIRKALLGNQQQPQPAMNPQVQPTPVPPPPPRPMNQGYSQEDLASMPPL